MSAHQRPVIAVVGGGVSVAALSSELGRALDTDGLELRLAARDLDRLHVIARHCTEAFADADRGFVATACRSLAEAVDGADAIVLMIRVGGLMARAVDESFPDAFGIAGDEGLGPGGHANALRTLPVLDSLTGTLLRHARRTPILNLVAPLGLTTRLLLDRGLPAVGVCELPVVTERALRACWPPGAAVDVTYAGFNHLGWFWTGHDATTVFGEAMRRRLVDADVLARFGAVPLKYYYALFDAAAAARVGLARPRGRAHELMRLTAQALADFEATPGRPSPAIAARPTPWFSDALVPILGSLLGGQPWRGYANLRNDGLIPALPADVVIEAAATFTGRTVEPHAPESDIPPVVLSFLERLAHAEQLVYRASPHRDVGLIVDALVDGPWALPKGQAGDVANAILAAADAHTSAAASI